MLLRGYKAYFTSLLSKIWDNHILYLFLGLQTSTLFPNMRKLLRLVSFTTLALVLGAQFALAQTPQEASAGAREELPLTDAPATVVMVETPKASSPTEQPKVAKAVQKPTATQQAKLDKKIQKAQKILNSRIGKWAVKRVAAKAERYAMKQAKKNPKLSPEDINKIKEAKKLSGNLRIAAILGIIGLILTLIDIGGNNILQVIGIILIVIALVLVLIELI
jgi:hypothetical protein